MIQQTCLIRLKTVSVLEMDKKGKEVVDEAMHRVVDEMNKQGAEKSMKVNTHLLKGLTNWNQSGTEQIHSLSLRFDKVSTKRRWKLEPKSLCPMKGLLVRSAHVGAVQNLLKLMQKMVNIAMVQPNYDKHEMSKAKNGLK